MSTMANLKPKHFIWRMEGSVALIQLDRPDRKNPLTFESYAELRDTFRALPYADDVDAVVFLPNGGNFCSGGDVHAGLRLKLTGAESDAWDSPMHRVSVHELLQLPWHNGGSGRVQLTRDATVLVRTGQTGSRSAK